MCVCVHYFNLSFGFRIFKIQQFHQLDDNLLCEHLYIPFSFYIL